MTRPLLRSRQILVQPGMHPPTVAKRKRNSRIQKGDKMSDALLRRYDELRQVDQELRKAESDLLAAHLNFGKAPLPRPETIYADVLVLRNKARHLLKQLGDALLSDSVDPQHTSSDSFSLQVRA